VKRGPRMIFKVIGLLVLLSGGAIVNVAVAWGCALCLNPTSWLQGPFGATAQQQRDYDLWDYCSNKIPGAEAHMYSVFVGLDLAAALDQDSRHPQLPQLSSVRARWEADEPLDDSLDSIFDARGFPLLSLWSRLDRGALGTNCIYGIQTAISKPMIQNGGSMPVCLPLRPIWPGFAINTVFYAAMLWVVFAGPGKLRRTIRRRRGLCPACAYPVGTSPVCTECGKPVKARSVESTPP
jgi:hypothetical protein